MKTNSSLQLHRPSQLSMVLTVLAAILLLGFSGCFTDKLAVFKKQVLNHEAMKAYVGDYAVERWPGNDKIKNFRVIAKDKKYYFAYKQDEAYMLEFIVSKIPNSKKGVHLISLPPQDQTNDASMFFLGRIAEEKTQIWMMFDNQPVVKGNLKPKDHKFHANELLAFLEKRADEYAESNTPQVVLVKKVKK